MMDRERVCLLLAGIAACVVILLCGYGIYAAVVTGHPIPGLDVWAFLSFGFASVFFLCSRAVAEGSTCGAPSPCPAPGGPDKKPRAAGSDCP